MSRYHTNPRPDYKQIVFYEKISNSVELIVRLKNDNLNGANFFRTVIKAYLEYDPKFMEWFNAEVKIPKIRVEKKKELFEEGRELSKDYYLNNEEIENIFDILEKIEDIDY